MKPSRMQRGAIIVLAVLGGSAVVIALSQFLLVVFIVFTIHLGPQPTATTIGQNGLVAVRCGAEGDVTIP